MVVASTPAILDVSADLVLSIGTLSCVDSAAGKSTPGTAVGMTGVR